MNSPDFIAHCLELLSPLGVARARRMFGGHGLYLDELFIAIVSDDRLYLKVDEQTRPHFEAQGCPPFVIHGDSHRALALKYRQAPDEALESPLLLRPWGRLAIEAALRARAAAANKPVRKAPAKKTAPRRASKPR